MSYNDPDTFMKAMWRSITGGSVRSPWVEVDEEWRTAERFDTGYVAEVKYRQYEHARTGEKRWRPISNGYTNLWRLKDSNGDVVRGAGS